MFTKISKAVNCDIEVTQEFINYRDNEIAKGTYNRYNDYKNCDYLLLEWYLIDKHLVDRPIHRWRHDFIIDGKKIDAKYISSKWFNIPTERGLKQLEESIIQNELDSFLFYTCDALSRKYVVGDVIKHKLIDIVDARSALKTKSVSMDKGWYIKV